MNFDINKFEKNIKAFSDGGKQEKKDRSGFINVVRHIWNHDPLSEINFDHFSFKDVVEALETMECIALNDFDTDELFVVDPQNPFIIYLQIDEVIFKLATSENKTYEADDNEPIFI